MAIFISSLFVSLSPSRFSDNVEDWMFILCILLYKLFYSEHTAMKRTFRMSRLTPETRNIAKTFLLNKKKSKKIANIKKKTQEGYVAVQVSCFFFTPNIAIDDVLSTLVIRLRTAIDDRAVKNLARVTAAVRDQKSTDQYLSRTHVGPHFDQDRAIWCHHEGRAGLKEEWSAFPVCNSVPK
ncbi:hypothetical protein EDC96DRAFT_564730 [Choanephora cucurbitarum]|nr:hypothetical protein EDC96DRAFT_564726 [Choanephora cucurbitarum]KAI8367146.1 hypothetical protein EDC96DRAFT_564730 [Choanephora cucurbitarum]